LKDPSKLDVTRDELWSRTRGVKASAGTEVLKLSATPETLFDVIGRLLTGNGSGEGAGYGRRLEIVLAIGAALFMLLPAVNLVNLNISRIMERAPEIGVRKAFGASSWTLVGQFVVENVFLTLVGAAIGLAITAVVLRAINASGLILYAELSLNYRIFGWGVVLAVAFGLLSGVYPAWRMSRMHPVQALNGVGR
jgi:putative ABC transport system permease protein